MGPSRSIPASERKQQKVLQCGPDLTEALQTLIDRPVVALASSTITSNDMEDALKTEDRTAELMLRKAHQADAWAVKMAIVASFFNRTALLWLRQMQAKVPAGDLRTHQDINKLIVAAEFSAEAH